MTAFGRRDASAGRTPTVTDPWTPPNRTPRELRNARVKVVGSCLILLGLIVVAAWALL